MSYGKMIAVTGLGSHLLFLFIFTIVHFIRPDKSVLASFVSEYALGEYGWLMTLGFLFIGVGAICLIIGLFSSMKPSKTAAITLCIWCIGTFTFSVFPTDLPGDRPTTEGLIHGLSALFALLNLSVAMIAWGFTFDKYDNWRHMAKLSWFFGAISTALFIGFLLSAPQLRGLTERILIILDITWIILVIRKLYTIEITSSLNSKPSI
ncbi:DUF998 domain-containing protein [Dyadobacter frigoris]|uniref:DUF998 domain-containing protein n=1 Tax=Dyadobacter frigoris TaxID=2576211 RepID=A0A4U6D618_9BACT|nr:DUF998 domain-containing protein [Dyadobacter frigoris]TKT92830.1 DUF998 domain-containing protein [Dyadobacter frigoris]